MSVLFDYLLGVDVYGEEEKEEKVAEPAEVVAQGGPTVRPAPRHHGGPAVRLAQRHHGDPAMHIQYLLALTKEKKRKGLLAPPPRKTPKKKGRGQPAGPKKKKKIKS